MAEAERMTLVERLKLLQDAFTRLSPSSTYSTAALHPAQQATLADLRCPSSGGALARRTRIPCSALFNAKAWAAGGPQGDI